MKTSILRTALFVIVSQICLSEAQTVSELQSNYSGQTTWDVSSGKLIFTSTGIINFDKQNYKNAYWDVPAEVKNIVINTNVQVTGAFHTKNTCTIAGMNRKTSVVFGTTEQRWADNRNLDEWNYCQFQNFGGVLTVKNLTALNPFSYFIRGWGPVNHVKSCDFIDNRGGWGNHSDGFSGGHGSTIDDCYFATGDDAIKCYFDLTVTNTTINMIQNCVPFQFGWGTYQNSTTNLSNITITGNSGRGSACPVFQWKSGSDSKKFTMNGCIIKNPKATIFELQSTGKLDLEISDALIDLNAYGTSSFSGTRIICDTTAKKKYYDCRTTDIDQALTTNINPSPFEILISKTHGGITIDVSKINSSGTLSMYSLQGKKIYSTIINKNQIIHLHKEIKAGVYLFKLCTKDNSYSKKLAIN